MKVIIDKKNSKVIARNIKVADTMISRLLGLMFIKDMKGFDGLILDPCNSVHNFFVRFATDVVFLNSQNEVIKILRNLKPWRVSWIYFKASKALELKAGSFPEDIKEGDFLEVMDV